MPTKQERKQRKLLRLRHEVLTEAHVRKIYADAGLRAGEDGFEELMERYHGLSDEAKTRHDALKAEIEKLA